MDENLPRWIWASLCKYFDSKKQTYELRFQGYDNIEEAKDSFQLRMHGPNLLEVSNNYKIATIALNVLVTTIRDEKDDHKVYRMTGIIGAAMSNPIQIYKYGNIGDNSLVGCLSLNSEIIITHFNTIEDTGHVLQSTVEAEFKLILN